MLEEEMQTGVWKVCKCRVLAAMSSSRVASRANYTTHTGGVNSVRSVSRSRSDSSLRQRTPSSERAASAVDSTTKRSRGASFLSSYMLSTSNSINTPISPQRKQTFLSLLKLLSVELNLPNESPKKPPTVTSKKQEIEINNSLEQISNLVKIPLYLEKFMVFGLLICLSSFLTLFTLVPLKLVMTFFLILKLSIFGSSVSLKTRILSIKRDAFTISLIIISVCVLYLPTFDISRLYHDVRGLAQIKLYVMFGVLEVADKLLSSIGQDILNILYSVNAEWKDLKKFLISGVLAILYLTSHGYVLIYQAVSLNVAANSYSNALLALLLSNQFSELKGSVFKKTEREGLFQMTMADLTERFQLSLMLGVIALRNIIQINSIHSGVIPNSWASWNKWLGAIIGPSIVVIGSEIVVDWLKHCYITKFNKVRPKVYLNFLYVLSLDYSEVFYDSTSENDKNDSNDYIVLTRRIGLPLLASIVCFLRVALPDIKHILFFNTSSILFVSFPLCFLAYITLLLVRLILGMVILKWANRIIIRHKQYQFNLRQQNAHDFIIKKIEEESITRGVSDDEQEDGINDSIDDSAVFDSIINPELATPPAQMTPKTSKSPMEMSFLPGNPNTERSTINPNTRSYLYDCEESVPPTPEEKRNNQLALEIDDGTEGLAKVLRYKMSSKRIY